MKRRQTAKYCWQWSRLKKGSNERKRTQSVFMYMVDVIGLAVSMRYYLIDLRMVCIYIYIYIYYVKGHIVNEI